MIGRPYIEFITCDERKKILDLQDICISEGEIPQIFETSFRRKDGTRICIEVNISTIPYGGAPAALVFIRDITERKKAEKERAIQEEIATSLKEKDVLLREIHHRVKNNLQMVSGLLDMTSLRTQNPQIVDLMTDTRTRIQTMAQIHNKLYQGDRFDRINMTSFVREQIQSLSHIYADKTKEIKPVIHDMPLNLTINQAIPCALVLNELISNCYKHAFKTRKSGIIDVSLSEEGDSVLIRVHDDGIGMPESFDISLVKSLGLKLVSKIVQSQLKGTISLRHDDGTDVLIRFPHENTE
jgi:two-component sensor histidine kinase